jgi:GNAT superfamily N-acetyltransferase
MKNCWTRPSRRKPSSTLRCSARSRAPTPCDRAVGLAVWYYTFSTFTGRPDMFLEDLFVEPAYRGRRIGIALLRHLARRAVAEKCRRIDWRVLNWNEPSIDFYERIGARPMEDWHVRQLGGAALIALAEGADHGRAEF